MWVVEIDLISVRGIKHDLISVSGSDLTCFSCVGDEKYFVLVSGSSLTWFLCRGIVSLHFTGGVEIDSIFVWEIEFNFILFSVGIEICFLCGGSKLTCVRAEIDFFSVIY